MKLTVLTRDWSTKVELLTHRFLQWDNHLCSCNMNPANGEQDNIDFKSTWSLPSEGSSNFKEPAFTTSPSPQRTALPLKRFLAQAPKRSLYQYNSIAQQTIIVKCFQSLWHDNIDYMQQYFFPNATGDRRNLSSIIAKHRQQLNTVGSTTLSNNTENVVLDEDNDGPEYWESQRGRQCGHVFKKGEAIYLCRYVCLVYLESHDYSLIHSYWMKQKLCIRRYLRFMLAVFPCYGT